MKTKAKYLALAEKAEKKAAQYLAKANASARGLYKNASDLYAAEFSCIRQAEHYRRQAALLS